MGKAGAPFAAGQPVPTPPGYCRWLAPDPWAMARTAWTCSWADAACEATVGPLVCEVSVDCLTPQLSCKGII